MSEAPSNLFDVLASITESDRSMYAALRFLDSTTRNHLLAAHLRNTSSMLLLVHQYVNQPPVTVIFRGGNDVSGNFMDPVPVVPTRAQVLAALQSHVGVTDTTCSICQENLTCATRIRACGHCFHSHCIEQWFTMNPRCPMCRIDIRDGSLNQDESSNSNEDSSMYSDEE